MYSGIPRLRYAPLGMTIVVMLSLSKHPPVLLPQKHRVFLWDKRKQSLVLANNSDYISVNIKFSRGSFGTCNQIQNARTSDKSHDIRAFLAWGAGDEVPCRRVGQRPKNSSSDVQNVGEGGHKRSL